MIRGWIKRPRAALLAFATVWAIALASVALRGNSLGDDEALAVSFVRTDQEIASAMGDIKTVKVVQTVREGPSSNGPGSSEVRLSVVGERSQGTIYVTVENDLSRNPSRAVLRSMIVSSR